MKFVFILLRLKRFAFYYAALIFRERLNMKLPIDIHL